DTNPDQHNAQQPERELPLGQAGLQLHLASFVEFRRMALARARWWSGKPSARAVAASPAYSAPIVCLGRRRPGLTFARSAGSWQGRRTDVAYRLGRGNSTDAAVWTAGYPTSDTV